MNCAFTVCKCYCMYLVNIDAKFEEVLILGGNCFTVQAPSLTREYALKINL